MQLEDLGSWLDRYFAAWKSNDPEDVAALFTEDAVYSYSPFRAETRGRDEIPRRKTDAVRFSAGRRDHRGAGSCKDDGLGPVEVSAGVAAGASLSAQGHAFLHVYTAVRAFRAHRRFPVG